MPIVFPPAFIALVMFAFFLWFAGMQIIGAAITGLLRSRKTGHLKPIWAIFIGAVVGAILALLSLILRLVAYLPYEGIHRDRPGADLVDPFFTFAAPPIMLVAAIYITWKLCDGWPTVKTLARNLARGHGSHRT